MKAALPWTLLLLTGCSVSQNLDDAAATEAAVLSVASLERTPLDAVYSWVTGRDCSIVRVDQGKSYCRPVEPEPEPPVFCTRTLGSVNCWQHPNTLPDHPRGVADGPSGLTPEQEADRLRRWPR